MEKNKNSEIIKNVFKICLSHIVTKSSFHNSRNYINVIKLSSSTIAVVWLGIYSRKLCEKVLWKHCNCNYVWLVKTTTFFIRLWTKIKNISEILNLLQKKYNKENQIFIQNTCKILKILTSAHNNKELTFLTIQFCKFSKQSECTWFHQQFSLHVVCDRQHNSTTTMFSYLFLYFRSLYRIRVWLNVFQHKCNENYFQQVKRCRFSDISIYFCCTQKCFAYSKNPIIGWKPIKWA